MSWGVFCRHTKSQMPTWKTAPLGLLGKLPTLTRSPITMWCFSFLSFLKRALSAEPPSFNFKLSSDFLHGSRLKVVWGENGSNSEWEGKHLWIIFFFSRSVLVFCINIIPSCSCNKVRERVGVINWEFRRWLYWQSFQWDWYCRSPAQKPVQQYF